MTFDLMSYEPRGDKKNSEFFAEYLPKIYERRQSSGVAGQVGNMRAVVQQVEPTALADTMAELRNDIGALGRLLTQPRKVPARAAAYALVAAVKDRAALSIDHRLNLSR